MRGRKLSGGTALEDFMSPKVGVLRRRDAIFQEGPRQLEFRRGDLRAEVVISPQRGDIFFGKNPAHCSLGFGCVPESAVFHCKNCAF